MTLRLGTRGSALALAQSRQVAAALTAATGLAVELVPITSAGDVTRASLASIGGTGVFATALRDALAAGECDLLVHSLKDLPTDPAPGLEIVAVPERADAADVAVTRDGAMLISRTGLRTLEGTVGTGSPRRVAQLRRANPDLTVRDLRGNVDSRLARVRSGELDAVILAAAGLDRLGPDADAGLARERLDLADWPTAAGQGALAVEVRADDSATRDAVALLDHLPTRIAVETERAALAALEAGCHAPVGATARLDGDALDIRVVVYSLDGARALAEDGRFALYSDGARTIGEHGRFTLDGARALADNGLVTVVGDALAEDGLVTLAGGMAEENAVLIAGGTASGADAGTEAVGTPVRTGPIPADYAEDPGGGNGAEAARDADPIARARRAGVHIARRLLARGAADLVE